MLLFFWAITSSFCRYLWKILICAKCAPGRGRSQVALVCSMGYCHFPLPSFLLYFFPTPSYVWPLKRNRVEGGFCWGLIINWPKVTSYLRGAMAYYSSIWDQWRPVLGQLRVNWWWRKADQYNMINMLLCCVLKPVPDIEIRLSACR